MAYEFTIDYQGDPIVVKGGERKEYYQLCFKDGAEKWLEHIHNGWRYVLPYRTDPDADENELLSEESSIELGLELEAEAIGKLIFAKLELLGK
jgi:hypothetical protein